MAIRPIFDTNVIINYRNEVDKIILSSYLPSIVFFELLATSIDRSELKTYTRWRNAQQTRPSFISNRKRFLGNRKDYQSLIFEQSRSGIKTQIPPNGRTHRPSRR
jgi:hypothetical protein